MNTHGRPIYLLTTTEHVYISRLSHYLCDENVRVIKDLQKVAPSDIVLPCCVKSQTMIYQKEVYKIFDNKTLFYEMVKNYFTLNRIRLIPTYDDHYQGDNKYSTFIIKPNEDFGSRNQHIETGYIYDLVDKYAQSNQIQDLLEIRAIYEIDFFCKHGENRGSIFHKTNAKTRKTYDYFFGVYSIELATLPEGMLPLCESIIKESNYNGFIQFEFIEDTNGTIYLMECNPRMSGSINNPHYFKKLIEPNYTVTSRFCDSLIRSNAYMIETEIPMFNVPYNFYQYLLYQATYAPFPFNRSYLDNPLNPNETNQIQLADPQGPRGYTSTLYHMIQPFGFLNQDDYATW